VLWRVGTVTDEDVTDWDGTYYCYYDNETTEKIGFAHYTVLRDGTRIDDDDYLRLSK
jgi:hypothetical protein